MRNALLIGIALFAVACTTTAPRMVALPDASRTAVVESEAELARELEACARMADLQVCRERGLAEHGRRVVGILRDAGGRTQPQMGGENRDCVGDREGDVEADCEDGEVEKIAVPCTHCVDGYGMSGGTCYLWVCVREVAPM